MISKNIVLIETIESTGTGFLYPCKYETDSFYQYFIVFTNSHVLQNIGLNQGKAEPSKNYKGQIFLSFYDNLGNIVSQENIKDIRIYNSGNFMRSEEDIAALLVAVRKVVPISLETRICHRQLDNRETLYLEGYPGVLLDDEVCSKIQLEGMEKKIFPSNEKLGIYQITDDYHWYNNYKDRSLLQGLSGSLVYLEKHGKSEILGMAQSVSDIQQGENPFKLMYYIKFNQILKHLREANCIVFFRETEDCYRIHWIYGMQGRRELNLSEKTVTLLLLGGSGAGKSSFAKDFAYHGNQICSTNDGQTTRTKVIYNYRLLNEADKNENENTGNRVDVKILTKEEFTERMLNKVGQRPALLIVQAIFQLKDVSIKNEVAFLENCYSLLQILMQVLGNLKTWWPDKMLDDIRAGIHHQLLNKEMIKVYEDIIETLCTYLPLDVVKYILDENYMMELRARCQQARQENRDFFSQESLEKDLLNIVAAKNYCESSMDNLDIQFKEFQKKAVIWNINKVDAGSNKEKIVLRLDAEQFNKAYWDSLLNIEGYFALAEFEEVFPEEEKEALIQDMEVYGRSVLEDKGKQFQMKFCSQMEEIYGKLHTRIKKYLINIYTKYGMSENYLNIQLNLDDMDDEKRKLLQKCLQVTPQGSLTGIINYVTVNDMVSDEYSTTLKDLQIGTLQLVDTCGLDHVGMLDQQELKNRLYEILYSYSGRKSIKLENISVVYLKKLDSGKPDELCQVFPCVREVFPASPVYCVFTGIDIFYRTTDEIDSLNWNTLSDWQPKAVNYLLSSNGRKLFDCCQKDGDGPSVGENMYLVMRNNLIPYCGKKRLVLQNYSYYKNNTTYIWKLLVSIVMKEYSSLEIIDTSLIDIVYKVAYRQSQEKLSIDSIICEEDSKKDPSQIKEMLEDVQKLINCMFCEASLVSYNYRYNTKQADIMSFCNRNKLGYYGTYRHRMDQRFHEGYVKTVEKEGERLAKHFSPSQAALIGALKNMESQYLGSGNNLTDLEPDSKNNFRKILEEMFAKCYERNPFNKVEYSYQKFEKERDEIFDEIYDFSKGLKDHEIMGKFVLEFLSCLKNQIYEDNKQKAENLLKLNPKFTEILEDLKKNYLEKYQINSDESEDQNQEEIRKKFIRLMNYYFVEH